MYLVIRQNSLFALRGRLLIGKIQEEIRFEYER